MLVNTSYHSLEISRKIDALVGKPYTLLERLQIGGTGSPPFDILESSLEIRNLLILDQNRNRCNVEIRPGGIIVGFRSLLESYALVIPYYKLSLLKGDLGVCTLHMEHHFLRLSIDTRATQKFVVRLLGLKAAANNTGPE
ncbi:MAG: hypothetical protein RLZZ241_481 [Bacteroidota bacterium]|jgi:hypothetical protein